ncbi:response regulator [Flagellimonas sp. HMM57]|uniref:response regulator n=1 Tax=unclassified Flagellimonas TaxID=2644544 RepID=UPI0013D41610|nr:MULTISPECIES: response regulator [unclassified Flagellimonas]UII76456.1 response regulator [Flagellimonas sp. HMM57]
MNYLFINDNKVQLMILKKALGQFVKSHKIRTLDNPMMAIDLIRSRVFLPDVIVVDFNMPVMDGLNFIKEMKFSNDWYSHIPIVVLTTVECAETAMECYRGGAAGYMVKPDDYRDLTHLLKVLIQYWEANLTPLLPALAVVKPIKN